LQRVLTTVTLLGLLVATAAAFAITEHLKLIKSPIFGAKISIGGRDDAKVFSPVCGCATSTATVQIELRHSDHVTVTIHDAGGHTVATLADGAPEPARTPTPFTWHGRTADGAVAPDGVYHPWIYLARTRHTYKFINKIGVDTKSPQVLSATRGTSKSVLFAGPGRTVAIRYLFSEPAHAVVYLGRRQIILGRRSLQRDKVKWAGTRGGRRLPAGTYTLSIGAQDIAGNETPANGRKQVTVVLSYIQVAPERITARRGRLFTVHVETAAQRYTWRLGKQHGSRRGRSLRLHAPTRPGTYRLVLAEHGHSTTAALRVRAK
jgi:FlgD Ig-like domain